MLRRHVRAHFSLSLSLDRNDYYSTVKVYTGVIDDLIISSRGKIRNLSDYVCATIQIYYVTHLGMVSNHKHAISPFLPYSFLTVSTRARRSGRLFRRFRQEDTILTIIMDNV